MSGRYSPGEVRDIAECLVDELREWTEGTEASTWGLLESAGYEPHEVEPEELREIHSAEEVAESGQISKEKWDSILHALYARMYLHEWRKRFVNPFMTGGTQWELRIGLTGGRRRTYSGNMYPVYWAELRRLMMSIF